MQKVEAREELAISQRGAGDLAEVAVTLVCVVGHEVGPL